METTEFIDEHCTVEIKRAVVYLTWPNGGRRAYPIDIFRASMARCNRALAEFDAKHEVVRLPRQHR